MRELELKRTYNCVLSQTISTSKRFLFAGNLFGDIFAFDLNELNKSTEEPPAKLKIFRQGSDVDVNCLAFHRDFLIVGAIGVIYGLQWDEEEQVLSSTRAWEIKIPMPVDAVQVPDVNYFWIRPETDTLYAGCGDSIIYQIDLEDGRIQREYSGHTDYIHSVVGHSDGRIFSSSEDGTVRSWCENQKEPMSMIEPHKNPQIFRADWGKWIGAVSVNEDWLVCGGGPRASIWHLGSMQCTQIFEYPGRVHICEFVDDSILIGGEHDHVQFYTLNGEVQANIAVENTASYSAVWQMTPFKFMSISGFSNMLHILKDFRFLDSKIEIYGNLEGAENNKDENEFCDSDDDTTEAKF